MAEYNSAILIDPADARTYIIAASSSRPPPARSGHQRFHPAISFEARAAESTRPRASMTRGLYDAAYEDFFQPRRAIRNRRATDHPA
jgi:hypothetical protein